MVSQSTNQILECILGPNVWNELKCNYQVFSHISTIFGSCEIHTGHTGLLKGPVLSLFSLFATCRAILGPYKSIHISNAFNVSLRYLSITGLYCNCLGRLCNPQGGSKMVQNWAFLLFSTLLCVCISTLGGIKDLHEFEKGPDLSILDYFANFGPFGLFGVLI